MAKKRRHATKSSAPVSTSNDSDGETGFVRRSERGIAAITSYDQVMDSEDEFHEQRDAIALGDEETGSRQRRRRRSGFDSDDGGDDQQVLALDIDSDSDADEDVDERVLDALDAEDEKLLAKSNRLLRTAKDYMEDDDEEVVDRATVGGSIKTKPRKGSKDADDDAALLAWGRSKKSFYDRDNEVEDDDEAAREELAETLKLQARRIEAMDESDFFGDDDELAPSKKETFGDSLIKRLRGTATPSADGATVLNEEDDGSVQIEKVDSGIKRDALAKMDAASLKALTDAQIPEVVFYLSEFDERWDEFKNVLGPSLRWMKESDNVDDDLVEAKKYLELKYGLLLSYLNNILFYLALVSNPPSTLTTAQVKSHPVTKVIDSLSKILTRLEKRVEGRNDKEAKEATKKATKEAEVASKEGKKRSQNTTQREADYKLSGGFVNLLDRIADFVESRIDGDGFGDEMDVENNGFIEDEAVDAVDDDDYGQYEDMEDEGDAEAEVEEEMDLKEMQHVLTSLNKPKPQLRTIAAKKERKTSKAMAEVFSEDDDFQIPEFVSTKAQLTKGKAKKAKAVASSESNDFGETDLNAVDLIEKLNRKRDLQFHVKRIDQAISKRNRIVGGTGDEDIPLRDKYGKLVVSKPQGESKPDLASLFAQHEAQSDNDDSLGNDYDPSMDFDTEDFGGLDEVDLGDLEHDDADPEQKRKRDSNDDGEGEDENEALAYYNKIAFAKKLVKEDKEGTFQAYKKSLERDGLYDNDLAGPGVKRATGWTIDANKGLTPRRKKEDRNSRVKIKNKFAKKQKKLSSIKAIVKDKSKTGAYRGEATGIKSTLTKSVKF
ncbi:hypothetical protein BC830DRAFT_1129748 [Chytriomyces sp. MP71]|nr:hypothetical protein BC830DRAFT_1129748 [Chytriomyces sp. MP71]